jgi:hypothetical protein
MSTGKQMVKLQLKPTNEKNLAFLINNGRIIENF